jgi:C1A family cysteine protease
LIQNGCRQSASNTCRIASCGRTTYGIATVWAAQKGGYSPTSATDQGAPDYTCNKRTQKKAGHCMMVIGYHDNRVYPDGIAGIMLKGAVLIQNSFGTQWGADGLVWMAYTTFQTMAEGSATYISAS